MYFIYMQQSLSLFSGDLSASGSEVASNKSLFCTVSDELCGPVKREEILLRRL